MAEEKDQVIVDVKTEENKGGTGEERVYSPDEQRAMEFGWKPKEEWDGDPEDWVSAKQFNQRGELFSRISKLQHSLKNTEETTKKLVEHNKKLYDAGYRKALSDLKAERKEAIDNGDTSRIYQIDEQIDELKDQHVEAVKEFEKEVKVDVPEVNPAFEQWVSANSWYNQDRRLRAYADGVAQDIVTDAKAKGVQPDFGKLLAEVTKEVRERFPEKFQRQRETGSVDTGGTRSGTSTTRVGSSSKSWNALPEEAKEIGMNFVRSGTFTKEEYAKQFYQINS